MDDLYKINAWKPDAEPGRLVHCDKNDPDASNFEIRYFVPSCGFMSSIDADSLFAAERIQSAMYIAFGAGKKAAFAELRNLIGVK